MGHAGTLDPFAEGLIVLLINKASKLSYCFLSKKKEYIASIKLGIKTDTWDITGKLLEQNEVKEINKKKIIKLIQSLKGEYNQQIPIFSAKKRMGKHLYDYARRDIKINEIKNKVIIYDIKFLSLKNDEFYFKICCSAGTYIRSIANDLGTRLGCGAVLSRLNRIKIGNFNLKDAINPEELANSIKSDTIINENNNFLDYNSYCKYKYIIPVKLLAERKKIIYVYKKYIKMLKLNSPLYGYMININKTNEKNINENDILIVKNYGSDSYYIHKSLINFNTLFILKNNQKLTKFILEINENN